MNPISSLSPCYRLTSSAAEKLERWAWVASIVPLTIFVVLLAATAYTTLHLKKLQYATSQTEARLAKDKEDISKLETKLQVSRNAIDILGKGSPEQTTTAFKQAASQVPNAALITIQIAYQSQLNTATEIAKNLRNLGYEVPPDQAIEIRGIHISQETYLRFFFEGDKKLAEHIVDQIIRWALESRSSLMTARRPTKSPWVKYTRGNSSSDWDATISRDNATVHIGRALARKPNYL